MSSGLVTEEVLARAEAAVAANPAEPGGGAAPAHDQLIADHLVRTGTLTAFQARELLAGKTRFRLGRYLVIDEIGRGGMGQVFKAEHELMGRMVAVKVLPRTKSTPDSEAAFRREMRILGRLDHENLVRAFDAGHDAMVYYLVTEFVPGMDLRRQVRKYGPLEEAIAATVFRQVARGLAYAHVQGVVHRDVKPGNILVMDDGRAKVLDMGLAGSTLEAEAVRLGRVVGTMDYIAPEQIRFPDDAGPAADLYALGCTLYFALSARVPFPGGTPREKMQRHLSDQPRPLGSLAPRVSRTMIHLVESLMQKDPADRFGGAAELAERLGSWAGGSRSHLQRASVAGVGSDWPGDRSASDADPSLTSDPGGHVGAWDSFSGPRLETSRPETSRLETSRPETWLESLRRDVREAYEAHLAPRNGLRSVLRVIGIALAVGIGFAGSVAMVQSLDPPRFQELPLIGRLPPAAFGWAGFLVMIGAQGFAAFAERRR